MGFVYAEIETAAANGESQKPGHRHEVREIH